MRSEVKVQLQLLPRLLSKCVFVICRLPLPTAQILHDETRPLPTPPDRTAAVARLFTLTAISISVSQSTACAGRRRCFSLQSGTLKWIGTVHSSPSSPLHSHVPLCVLTLALTTLLLAVLTTARLPAERKQPRDWLAYLAPRLVTSTAHRRLCIASGWRHPPCVLLATVSQVDCAVALRPRPR